MIQERHTRPRLAIDGQYIAYAQEFNPNLVLNTHEAVNARFGIGSAKSIGSITIPTPLGNAEFHVVENDIPFLLCLRDLDQFGAYYNNLTDLVVMTPTTTIPVTRRFGHPFILWDWTLSSFIVESVTHTTECHLTSTELSRLHRRFGHPSSNKLANLIERSGHDFDRQALNKLTKFCTHCQKHAKSPGRFKFTLRDDSIDFNGSVFLDIMYINGQPVLHIIDEATKFQAARWLKDVSAATTWDTLKECWIDTYLGPPDRLTHDAGRNFASREFRQNAATTGININVVPVEAHWSVGIVERAHPMLRRAYEIIVNECPGISKNLAVQTAVKAINDTAGPDGLVPTLLVFGAYPRLADADPPAPSIAQRAWAVRKRWKKFQNCTPNARSTMR